MSMTAKVEHAGPRQAYLCLPNGYSRKMAIHDAQRIAAEANESYKRVEAWDNDPAWRGRMVGLTEALAQ